MKKIRAFLLDRYFLFGGKHQNEDVGGFVSKDIKDNKKWQGRPKTLEDKSTLDDMALERQDLRTLIGARIRLRRQAVGITQKELASQVGLSTQQLQKYENASNRISIEVLIQIAFSLGVPVSWLTENPEMDQFALENNVFRVADRVSKEFTKKIRTKHTSQDDFSNGLTENDKQLLSLFRRVKKKSSQDALLRMLKAFVNEDV